MLMPTHQGFFPTDDGHQLYWERHGSRGAEPIFFLHGGPGGRSTRHHLAFFDLHRFDVILFDQRGCGRSMPHGELQHNDTGRCVDDIEALRHHLGFAKISLLGVSWGSWLAIQYQQRYPQAVLHTTLVSVFVPFAANVSTYDQGLSAALAKIKGVNAGTRPRDIHAALSSECATQRRKAALLWLRAMLPAKLPGMQLCLLDDFVDEEAVRAIRLELHYHVNDYFFTPAHEHLSLNANTRVIQGLQDPFGMASVRWLRQRQDLHCRLVNAGHNAFHGGLLKATRRALKRDRQA